MTTQSHRDAPAGWDLDWEPTGRSGAPDRWPPLGDAIYAEFPLRATAFAIDVALITMLSQLLSQVMGLVLFWVQRGAQQAADAPVALAGSGVFLGALALSATSIYFWRVFRATPGQMLFGLFVVRRGRGSLLSRGAATVRWLALYAPVALMVSYNSLIQGVTTLFRDVDPVLVAATALLLPLAWYLVLALSTLAEARRGRGLHDRLSGSVVVRRAGPPA
jgi:uncharacterized RDD family membrane protein YckC